MNEVEKKLIQEWLKKNKPTKITPETTREEPTRTWWSKGHPKAKK